MRVVILYNSSWYVFLLRQNLVASLNKAGCNVTVVAPEDAYTERVKNLGVSFVPVLMSRSGTSLVSEALTVSQIYQALRKVRPDVVLSFTVKCNLYAGLCKRRLAFKHVANISGLGQLFDQISSFRRLALYMYRFALARTENVFFQNRDDLSHLVGQEIVAPQRATLLPGSGVDLERFVPTAKMMQNKRTFLMFGRLLPKKGFAHFLEAARILSAQYGARVSFWILGAVDHERSESQALLQDILDAHAKGIVRYLQSTDDPLPYIREADVVVLPSTYNEGIPRSLLEALACGKPIVTTDWKGCRETVEDGQNGFLVVPDNTEALTRAMHDLVVADNEKLNSFGKRSREIAEARFDEGLVLSAYHRAVGVNQSLTSEVAK